MRCYRDDMQLSTRDVRIHAIDRSIDRIDRPSDRSNRYHRSDRSIDRSIDRKKLKKLKKLKSGLKKETILNFNFFLIFETKKVKMLTIGPPSREWSHNFDIITIKNVLKF